MIKFILNGCDISFYAEAPEDITLKQLLKQADRIRPDWCSCGIHSSNQPDKDTEIIFTYNDVFKTKEDVSCIIEEQYQPRCNKCVYEFECDESDEFGYCTEYKRDPPDGGYYG